MAGGRRRGEPQRTRPRGCVAVAVRSSSPPGVLGGSEVRIEAGCCFSINRSGYRQGLSSRRALRCGEREVPSVDGQEACGSRVGMKHAVAISGDRCSIASRRGIVSGDKRRASDSQRGFAPLKRSPERAAAQPTNLLGAAR
jgi:hypothetical protein